MAPHILIATLQSAFLSLCSSLVATYFTTSNPPILALVTFSFLSTPPNYLWQHKVEKLLPGFTTKKIEVDDGGRGVEVEKKLNIKNTAMKFAFDQTVLALINVTLFIGGVRLLQGVPLNECLQAVQEQTMPMMFAGYKLWPAVSLLNYTVIPVERRTLVGSLVGLGWGVYLAITASR